MIKFLIIICGLFTCFCAFGIGVDTGRNQDRSIGGWLFSISAVLTLFVILIS